MPDSPMTTGKPAASTSVADVAIAVAFARIAGAGVAVVLDGASRLLGVEVVGVPRGGDVGDADAVERCGEAWGCR